uniref:thymidine phosphorylase n=1 Tax=Ndongobacter massiliensis TaxID=1871025 RepID=UPI00093084E4|nr:thymidine phosphorylase [Ndongobacter massiliensis]
MNIVDLILKKRDGEPLMEKELSWFVQRAVREEVADYQISAFLMAIYFRGMNREELAAFTRAMAQSGEQISFPSIERPIVDKHSSGGVGDKTSLIVAPIVAALGLPVAKLSGRGLGFTGGTVDKLESIPGFRTELSEEEFMRFVARDGIALMGQSANIAPADKKLYALRDVTGTVDSIPLIASSIMSKKLADGSDAIVLDVKCGSGAFMKTKERALALAQCMVSIGEENGKKTIALVTDMNQPLGRAVGNNLEVIEAIQTLHGEGPEDLVALCRALAVQMLLVGGRAKNTQEAAHEVQRVVKNGEALQKFRIMVENQGGNPDYVDFPQRFPRARLRMEGRAKQSGFVEAMDTEAIGHASLLLGAGRARVDASIDSTVGLLFAKKVGDPVQKGDLLFTVCANEEKKGVEAVKRVCGAYHFSDTPAAVKQDPVIATVTKDGVKDGESEAVDA